MNPLQPPVSTWIELLDRQLVLAKHVLLYGNTFDLALYSGMASRPATQSGCTTFDDALHRYLIDAGFSLVLHFNIADGLQLVEPSMAECFERACAARGGAAEGQRFENQLNVAGDTAGAVENIRRLLSQDRVSCAVVMHFADKLVQDAQHQGSDESQILVRLLHAMQGARFASNQTSVRNTFIGVASQLTAVPGWLYMDNPRIALVPASRPNARERRHWIGTRLPDFHCAADLPQERSDDLVRELADRTDGMSLFDISLLPRVSHAEQIRLESPHELVRAARFGKKEDPWRELDPKRLDSAAQLLGARVKGQQTAIDQVVSTLHQAFVGIHLGSNRAHGGPPKGVFFFVGPTGVGKTELAKSIAELVFGDDDRMKVFDMAEYQLDHAGDRLTGAPVGYQDSEKGGQLTNHVLSEPFSVILFDEIEKANDNIWDKFLGIIEEGRLTDGRGMTAYFDQSILVFTSNIGSDTLISRLEAAPDDQPSYDELSDLYHTAVRTHFSLTLKRPELEGRFGDSFVVFDMLRPELVAQLCGKFLAELRDNSNRERRIDLNIDHASIVSYLTRRMREPKNLKLGGRRVQKLIDTTVVRPLNDYIFTNKTMEGSRLHLSMCEADERISIRSDTGP